MRFSESLGRFKNQTSNNVNVLNLPVSLWTSMNTTVRGLPIFGFIFKHSNKIFDYYGLELSAVNLVKACFYFFFRILNYWSFTVLPSLHWKRSMVPFSFCKLFITVLFTNVSILPMLLIMAVTSFSNLRRFLFSSYNLFRRIF